MLTLLHTSPVHVSSFDALRDRIAPGTPLTHIVRKDLLDRALARGVTPEIATETAALIRGVNGPVLCTCTTLGIVAEQAGAIRIDRPVMRAAAETGRPVILAYCLNSTAKASLDLLKEEMTRAGNTSSVMPMFLEAAWPHFEAGDIAGFHKAIAETLRNERDPQEACLLLAQASMAGASALLGDLDVPILSSPEPALRFALGQV